MRPSPPPTTWCDRTPSWRARHCTLRKACASLSMDQGVWTRRQALAETVRLLLGPRAAGIRRRRRRHLDDYVPDADAVAASMSVTTPGHADRAAETPGLMWHREFRAALRDAAEAAADRDDEEEDGADTTPTPTLRRRRLAVDSETVVDADPKKIAASVDKKPARCAPSEKKRKSSPENRGDRPDLLHDGRAAATRTTCAAVRPRVRRHAARAAGQGARDRTREDDRGQDRRGVRHAHEQDGGRQRRGKEMTSGTRWCCPRAAWTRCPPRQGGEHGQVLLGAETIAPRARGRGTPPSARRRTRATKA